MPGFVECQQNLLITAKGKGFLTFDDILDAASTFLLSASEIDRLSDNLQSLGVLLYESEPEQFIDEADAFSDYSRTDYDAIFSEIISLSESLSPLIDIVKDVPPPQFGEVQNLVEQLQYENEYARERLILSHLRIALKIALSISKQYSYHIEDAVSSSFIGLMEAVERFDPNGFSAFQSYASMWIQQNIHRYCNPIWLQYYCPVHVKEKMYPALLKYNKNNGTLINDDSFDVELVRTIAEDSDLTPMQVERILRFAHNQLYGRFELDSVSDSESEIRWIDNEFRFIDLEHLVSPDDDLFEKAARSILRNAFDELLDTFTPREQEIICLRFGFGGVPQTLEEVGQIFNITRERVRQIENKCIRSLRHPSKAKKIRDFYC